MGIDIEFQAVIPKVLTEAEVDVLFDEMEYLFGAKANIDKVRILKQEDLFFDVDFEIPEGHTLLDFYTLCRLYSDHYERGHPFPWFTYADFIEWKYPGSYVSYCGDCYKHISPWTKEDREKLKLYYFEHGNRPYNDKRRI